MTQPTQGQTHRWTGAFLAALACALAAGCGPAETQVERGVREQVLYVGAGAEAASLDPHLVTGVTEHYILLALFEGLVTRDPATLEIRPGVARNWKVSPDGRRHTFYLDPTARWSNGDPVTAGDFLFAFRRILSPELGAPYAYMLYAMRGARAYHRGEVDDFAQVGASAPDESTLVIELESPTPYFLSLLTHYTWWPVHPPTVLAHGDMTDRISDWTRPGNLVGNGPFRLDSWRLSDRIVVAKNPLHRTADEVRLNAIHFLSIQGDAEERAFRAGFLHLTSTVPIHRIDWYRKHRPEAVRFDTYLGTYYYSFNTRVPPLDDVRVRRALAYAVDREELTRHVLRAGQKPAGHFTPPNTAGYNAEARFPYDPGLARDLLAEAGFPGGKGFPRLELLYNTSESHRALALAVQQMWKRELGIEITLHNQEWKAYLATREAGDFEIMRAGWIGDYDDPHTFLSLLTSDSGNNHSGWSDPRYDALIAESQTTADNSARHALFQQAEARLLEEMPVIPLYFYVRSLLIHESVRGWHPNLLDYHPYQGVWLEGGMGAE